MSAVVLRVRAAKCRPMRRRRGRQLLPVGPPAGVAPWVLESPVQSAGVAPAHARPKGIRPLGSSPEGRPAQRAPGAEPFSHPSSALSHLRPSRPDLGLFRLRAPIPEGTAVSACELLSASTNDEGPAVTVSRLGQRSDPVPSHGRGVEARSNGGPGKLATRRLGTGTQSCLAACPGLARSSSRSSLGSSHSSSRSDADVRLIALV